MAFKLKVTTVGNSTGVVLPKEILGKLRLGRGDCVFLSETPGGYELSPHDPEFETQIRIAEEIMREDRDVMRALS